LAGCTFGRQEKVILNDMVYTLRTNYYEFTNEILSARLFEEIIDNFSPNEWDFMVLSPDKPINYCTFIQVGAPDEITDYHFTIEIGFYNDEDGLIMYRFYTLDKNFVLQCFNDYWRDQKIPDYSKWEDVSDEMK
jgi:hypothetical protein